MTAIRTLRPQRRPYVVTTALALVVALTSSSADAQRRGGAIQAAGGGNAVGNAITGIVTDSMMGVVMGPLIFMCQVAEVFNEMTVNVLRLPKSQIEKLLSINADMKAKLDALNTLPRGERREKLLAILPNLEKEYVARVNEHLDAEQRVIFRNLLLNIRGPMTFADPDVATALGLTDEQRKKVGEALTDAEQRLKRTTGTDRELGALDIASILSTRKRRDETLLAVLTPEQKEAWTKLKGPPPIDVDAVIKKIAAAQLASLVAKPKAEQPASSAGTPTTDPAPSAPPAPAAPSATTRTKPR